MALIYTGSNIAAGAGLFGVTGVQTQSIWGATFIEDGRFLLVLYRRSDGTMMWKKLDPLTIIPTTYDMLYTPSDANVAPADRVATVQGEFLTADSSHLYYVKGNTLYRRDITNGGADGTHSLRETGGSVLNGATISGLAMSADFCYVTVVNDAKLYVLPAGFDASFDDSSVNAVEALDVPELVDCQLGNGGSLIGSFIQPVTNDFVLVLSDGTTMFAIKFDGTTHTRKGTTPVIDGETGFSFGATHLVAVAMNGSVIHLVSSDNTAAVSGLYVYRLADASTGIVAKDKSGLYFDKDRVKAGSNDVVKVTFRARDGYGEQFAQNEYVRFSMVQTGTAWDADDGALAALVGGPFRDVSGAPLNTTIDVPFDVNGEAVCYWQAPQSITSEALLDRIHVRYPI